MTKRRKKGKKKNTDKSRKTLSRPSRRKFLYQKNLSVPSRVKIPNIVADMDSTESSFSKPKERISIPLEKGISIREPQPHTHTKVQADAEAQNESINSEYNKKGKRKISADDPVRDSARSTLKRIIRDAAANRFREKVWLQQQRDSIVGISTSSKNFRRNATSMGIDALRYLPERSG